MREVLFVESMHPNTKEIESEFNIVQEELAANQAKLVTLKADVAELEVTKRELMDYREEKVKIRSRVTEARERLSSDKKKAVEKQWYQVGLEILGAPLISFPETETPMEDDHGAVGDDKALVRGTEAVEAQVVSDNKVGTEEGPALQVCGVPLEEEPMDAGTQTIETADKSTETLQPSATGQILLSLQSHVMETVTSSLGAGRRRRSWERQAQNEGGITTIPAYEGSITTTTRTATSTTAAKHDGISFELPQLNTPTRVPPPASEAPSRTLLFILLFFLGRLGRGGGGRDDDECGGCSKGCGRRRWRGQY